MNNFACKCTPSSFGLDNVIKVYEFPCHLISASPFQIIKWWDERVIIVYGHSKIPLIVAKQTMTCLCKTLAMNMNSFVGSCQFSRFTIRCATSDWLRRGQNAHCIMGKCRQIKCRAIRNYTWLCFKWPIMWIKRLHAKIHNIITVYIHYWTIYLKTIT